MGPLRDGSPKRTVDEATDSSKKNMEMVDELLKRKKKDWKDLSQM